MNCKLIPARVSCEMTDGGDRGYYVTMLKDATAGFTTVAKNAATDLIWPLFANEVLTVEEWKKSLEK